MPVDAFGRWAVHVMETLGGFGAALLIALESFFPPLPSEVILPLAGFSASRGSLGLVEVILWCTLGSLVGAWALYGIGAGLGRDRTRALLAKLPLIRLEDIDKAEQWFHKHGRRTVFLGRMIPGIRSLISIPAGMTKMAPWLFTLLTAAGSLVWNAALVLAGYWLGERWSAVQGYVKIIQDVVIVAVAAWFAWMLVKRIREHRARKPEAEPGDGEEATEAAD